MIEFRDIYKSFGGQPVLQGLSLQVNNGEILCIIGTSGVGKSVTIKHLIGLLQPDRGEIFLDDRPVQHLKEKEYYPIRQRCGMVFQNSTLFDSLTLIENVMLPLRKHKRLKTDTAQREALRLLEVVHLERYADRYPAELGDGMRKRAAIARALSLDPEYMLFDEPTTGLDPVSARRVDQLIQELQGLGVTSIVVSHDLTSIFNIAHRIAFLYQGRVYLLGTPQEFKESTDSIVKQFINGESNGPLETPGF